MENCISPTKEQSEVVARKALKAAYDELSGINDCEEYNDEIKKILMAFAACRGVIEKENAGFIEANCNDERISFGHSVIDRTIVAIAVYAAYNDMSPADIHPYSVVSIPIENFASACMILNSHDKFRQ